MKRNFTLFLMMLAQMLVSNVFAQNTSSGNVSANGYTLSVTADHSQVLSEEILLYTVSFSFPVDPNTSPSGFRIRFDYDQSIDLVQLVHPNIYGSGGGTHLCLHLIREG